MAVQVAMYKLIASSGGYKLEVASLGLYSLDGQIEDVLACHDSTSGELRIHVSQASNPEMACV